MTRALLGPCLSAAHTGMCKELSPKVEAADVTMGQLVRRA